MTHKRIQINKMEVQVIKFYNAHPLKKVYNALLASENFVLQRS